MTEQEMERELHDLKERLALLQKEHTKTRKGWLYLQRHTGFLLSVLGASVLIGVWGSHPEHNPVAATLGIMSIFMLVMGAWLWFWSLRPAAERLMRVASSK
jgi:hypothetical protein